MKNKQIKKQIKKLTELERLIRVKKLRYSKVDITQPMSVAEKNLNKRIAFLFSEINEQIRLKRKK